LLIYNALHDLWVIRCVDTSSLELSGTVTDNADKVRQKDFPQSSLGNGGATWQVTHYATDGSVAGEHGGTIGRRTGLDGDFDFNGNYLAKLWWVDNLPLEPGRNEITITAQDKAGKEASKNISVVFVNDPPILKLIGPEAALEASDYPLGMIATDKNNNLKQIHVQWGDGETYTHPITHNFFGNQKSMGYVSTILGATSDEVSKINELQNQRENR
jgi:hypothetical protein